METPPDSTLPPDPDASTATPSPAGAPPPLSPPVDPKSTPASWLARIAAAERTVKDLLPDWRMSVNYRVMLPFKERHQDRTLDATPGSDRVALAEDWSRTKQKQSQLSFQLPKIVATHGRPEDAPFVPHVTAAVNYVLQKACKAYYMVDECLADVINAAGIMVSKVAVEVITETVPLPAPPQLSLPIGDGLAPEPAEPTPITRVVARRFKWDRVSPSDFLWPAEFRSSHWDQAPWLGHKALVPVETCKKHPIWGPILKNLNDAGKQTPTVYDGPTETLAKDVLTRSQAKAGTVPCYLVKEIVYKAALFDADALHPDHLRILVVIDGLDDPVQQENMDEQQWVPGTPGDPGDPGNPAAGVPARPPSQGQPGYFKGLTCFPLRVTTLTYVSDLAVPPSDSRAARAQINELMRSRAQMLRQRDTSIPIRWYDVNRVDEEIARLIDRGDWQAMIPMNGPGDRAVGEVARANYPRENFQFQSILGRDLDGAWSLSSNQLGNVNDSERSATEVQAVQSASAIRLDYEKAKVNRYIAEGSAAIWSLMQRYTTGPEFVEIVGAAGAKILTALPPSVYGGSYQFDFVPDTSDRIDIHTKQQSYLKLYNLMRNSLNVNGLAMDRELFTIFGQDPDLFVQQAPPKPPAAPNVSYRFGGEDLLNPIAVAVMMKDQQLAPPDISAAAAMIQDALAHMAKIPPPGIGDGTPNPQTPPPAPPAADGKVEPPPTVSPILKRASDGSRLT